MKKIIGLFPILIILSLLSACSFSPNMDELTKVTDYEKPEEHADSSDENLIVVGVSQLGSESAWRTAHSESIQNALTKENGYFLLFDNGRQKQENQIKAIRSFISQRVDYIVLCPCLEDGWETVLAEARDAGIPVILSDRSISVKDDSLYTTRVGINARDEGEKAGKWLENELIKEGKMDEEINILVIQGTNGSSSQRGRAMGFDSICDQHANWHILAQVDGDFTTSKGKEVMEQLLDKYDDFDVIVSQNDDMTMGALEALNKAGVTTGVDGDVILISFDATKEALELVKEGIINVDIECNPNQGEYISEVIRKLEAGEEVDKLYIVDENVFTKDNVSDFIEDRTY